MADNMSAVRGNSLTRINFSTNFVRISCMYHSHWYVERLLSWTSCDTRFPKWPTKWPPFDEILSHAITFFFSTDFFHISFIHYPRRYFGRVRSREYLDLQLPRWPTKCVRSDSFLRGPVSVSDSFSLTYFHALLSIDRGHLVIALSVCLFFS